VRIDRQALGGLAAVVAVGVAAWLLLGLPRPSLASDSTPTRPSSAQVLQGAGEALYLQTCASCHGVGGVGTASAPSLVDVGAAAADFQLRTGRMPASTTGAQPPAGRPNLTEADIEALVAYVASLGNGPGIPDVDVTRGDPAEGRDLYIASCAACHGAGASGDSVGGGFIAPPLLDADPTTVGEAIRTGPGAMPVFGPNQLTAQDLDSIAAYLATLRSQEASPGGLPISRVGPVAEGYVAWFVGIGLLVLAALWTERRRRRGSEPVSGPASATGPDEP